MTTRFFVYGSMSEGMVHWSKINDFIRSVTPAKVRGTAWRLPVGFPAVVLGGDDWIEGSVVDLQATDFLVNLLDEFHGVESLNPAAGLHLRTEVEILLAEDQGDRAWIYALNPAKIPPAATPILSGDWQQELRQRPALTEQLTDRQKDYLRRLGAATGREIVPMNDMSLYRELMNLELIVDKGRRLALSKLGVEVVRYL